MSEEIRHPGMEISEAALKNVSGGIAYSNDPYKRATEICFTCNTPSREHHNCPYGPEQLAQYMRDKGMINAVRLCPYR